MMAAAQEPGLYALLCGSRLRSAGHLSSATLELDRAQLRFEDGELYLTEPVAGQITGAVFLGRGAIHLTLPNAVERQQLEKFTNAEKLEERFERLVLRFSDDTDARLLAQANPARRPEEDKAQKLWKDRHDDIFDERLANPNARVLWDLINGRDIEVGSSGYILAEIDGIEHDWFTLEIDPILEEEVRLYKAHSLDRRLDYWSSFHRLADYGDASKLTAEEPAPGAPVSPVWPRASSEGWRPVLRIHDTAIDIELEQNGKIKASADLTIEALTKLRSVRLMISVLLNVTTVEWITGDDEPTQAEFVQAHNPRGLKDDRWEPWITVKLPIPVAVGQQFRLRVSYEGELLERLRNGDFLHRDTENWYPSHPHADRSRFAVRYDTPEKYRVASSGMRLKETLSDNRRIAVWEEPSRVRAISFHLGEFDVDNYEPEDAPPITIYSSRNQSGFAPGNQEDTLSNLVEASKIYRDYFGDYPFESLLVVETPGLGGQAFAGFIRLSFLTFGAMHTGEAELFRSHELAHQWWGASIGWKGYRDQWMSEGFAQYAAALYALKGLREKSKFEAMMSAWRMDILNKVDLGQRLGLKHYGFVPTAIQRSNGSASGALWVGYRLASDETPFDYRLLAYEKGAYVLHMLRMMLIDLETGDDVRFRELMRSFAREWVGREPATEDFLASVSEQFKEPMGWFFDQWIYGVEIPTYLVDLSIEVVSSNPDHPYALRGRVRQQDVSKGFRMPVLIWIDLRNGRSVLHRVWIDAPEVEIDIPLPSHPRQYRFNDGYSVLADVKN